MLLQEQYLLADLVGAQEIVGIEVLKEISLCLAQRGVSSRGSAAIVLAQDFHICALVAFGDGVSLIVRAVIDDDDFRIGPGLIHGGLQRGAHKALGIVGWNEDGNFAHQMILDISGGTLDERENPTENNTNQQSTKYKLGRIREQLSRMLVGVTAIAFSWRG